MSKLVTVERYGSKIGLFFGTKGFAIIMVLVFMFFGAIIFAMILNQGMSARFVKELGKAFDFNEAVANRYSLAIFIILGLSAYLMLMATGIVGKKIITEDVINANGEIEVKSRYIGKNDFIKLKSAIVGMEVFVLFLSWLNEMEFSWVSAGVVLSFQVFFVFFIDAGMNVMRGARDLASKKMEVEHEKEHEIASENATSAFQAGKTPIPINPIQVAKSSKQSVNLGGTNFEIKKSKVA